MTDFSRIPFLLDFYGGLLSERSFSAMDMHFNEDRSLAEIGEQLGISRQAVSDLIARSKDKLESYEAALGLADRFLSQREQLTEIRAAVTGIDRDVLAQEDRDTLAQVDQALTRMIGDL
ncbi:MAG: hypothetical protein IKC38_03720 [Clostridia bacterium]|nr:hypothetical protein [Clostridia bacterium]